MDVMNNAVTERSVQSDMMISRQAQEVQAAMVIAKKFPRDEFESCNRIQRACSRKGLAEKAMYEYPRGGTKVTGPSIRLAEAIAQNWGNIDFGFIELESKKGESQVMAYAWDLETNTRQTKVFSVPHVRGTKNGNIPLTDPRDIYEMVANQSARRVRACILSIIPGDIVEDAVNQCKKTLIDGEDRPISDITKEMAAVFEKEFSVPLEAIEKYIGCKAKAFTMNDLIRLKGVYKSLADGMKNREDYFDLGLKEEDSAPDVFDAVEKEDNPEVKKESKAEETKTEPKPEKKTSKKQEKKDEQQA